MKEIAGNRLVWRHIQSENMKYNDTDKKKFEALEKRVETLEKKHQDLIDNLRIFMVKDNEEERK